MRHGDGTVVRQRTETLPPLVDVSRRLVSTAAAVTSATRLASPRAAPSRDHAVRHRCCAGSTSRRRSWAATRLPAILVVNRPGKDERRDRLLHDIPTKAGFDRDEYPPAVGRGRVYRDTSAGSCAGRTHSARRRCGVEARRCHPTLPRLSSWLGRGW